MTTRTGGDWREIVRAALTLIESDLQDVLVGVDSDVLDRMLAPGSNSIGWLSWHLTRSHDRNMSEIAGGQQLWVARGWAERFGRCPDPRDTGYRHTKADVRSFSSPEPQVILAYHRDTIEMIGGYLDSAPADDFDRSSYSPTLHNWHPVGDRILAVIRDGFEHVGQAAFLRGLFEANAVEL